MKKISGSTTTVYVFSGSKIIVEYDNGAAPGSPSREYIYSGSTLLAKIDSTGRKYYHRDHLSNRVVTDSSGAVTAQVGHYPYGESWYNASNDKLIFTSYQRDSESGNDYAQARYYVSRIGRFSAVDPLSGNTGDPQSLNRYSYVRNAPTVSTDPSGQCTDGFIETKRKPRLEITGAGTGILPSELEETLWEQSPDEGPCLSGGAATGGGGGSIGGYDPPLDGRDSGLDGAGNNGFDPCTGGSLPAGSWAGLCPRYAPSYSVSLLSFARSFSLFSILSGLFCKNRGVSIEPFELNRSSVNHFLGVWRCLTWRFPLS